MKLYMVVLSVTKLMARGFRMGQREIKERKVKTFVSNEEGLIPQGAYNTFSEFKNIYKCNYEPYSNYSGLVSLFEPEISENGLILEQPKDGKYIHYYDKHMVDKT